MLTEIHPKLPMRDRDETKAWYGKLGFLPSGGEYADYLMMKRDQVEIHFFLYKTLDPKENYGQVYIRTHDIDALYRSFLANKIPIHPNGALQDKHWGQREFSLLDPDSNLLTFGQQSA